MREKQLKLVINGSITVDCTGGSDIDAMTKAFLQIAGVFVELERNMISDRVKSGMENAKSKGAIIGRPKTTRDNIPDLFYKHYPSFKNGTLNASEFARVCNISRSTLYKYLKIIEEQ